MKVDLISLSQPNISGIRTAEEFISYCARVSNPPNQLNTHTAGGLLRYCIKHNHFSIFEMVNLVFEIETSRDIGRQIIRHRSFSFQEFSQRYAEADEVPILRQTRLQDTKNKQNSIQTDDVVINQDFIKGQQDLWEHSQKLYKQALTNFKFLDTMEWLDDDYSAES